MGYDMSMVGDITEAEEAALKAMQDKIDAAGAERIKHEPGTPEHKAAMEEIGRLYDERFELPSNYYRLNIWGMSSCQDFMLEREMVYLSSSPDFPDPSEAPGVGVFPTPEDFETGEKYEAAAEEWEEKYAALIQPILEAHPEGGDTIPIHKFGSNDGWHVTEAECAAAVAAARASGLPEPTVIEDGIEVPVQWWASWVDFLDRASTRGGFTVR